MQQLLGLWVFMMVLVAGKVFQCEHMGNKTNMLLHLHGTVVSGWGGRPIRNQ